MSMNLSLFLVEGDQSGNLRELFSAFGYVFTGNIERVRGDDRRLQKISFPRKEPDRWVVYKGVLVEGRWTAILDGEFVMIVNRSVCENLAAKIKGEVFGFLAGGTSGTYALYQYSQSGRRELFVQENEVVRDEGNPLPEEHGINKPELSEIELLTICEAKGFKPDLFQSDEQEILLVELAEPIKPRPQVAETPKPVPQIVPNTTPNPPAKKPWWSFLKRT